MGDILKRLRNQILGRFVMLAIVPPSKLRKVNMKLEWVKNKPWTQELIDSWNLCVVKEIRIRDVDARKIQANLGTLYQTETGYIILERGNEQNPYILDGDLTLDEAQRAAKLFLCVGEKV